jgi:uncharacterized protein (TIGR02466 family)
MLLFTALVAVVPAIASFEAAVESVFSQLDSNDNDSLSRLEVRRGVDALELLDIKETPDNFFAAADTDQGRTVTLAELLAFMKQSNTSPPPSVPPPPPPPPTLRVSSPLPPPSSLTQYPASPPSGQVSAATAGGSLKQHADCNSCVAAGGGWHTQRGRCSKGFANKVCARAPTSVAAGVNDTATKTADPQSDSISGQVHRHKMGEVRRAAAGLTAELRTDIARLSAQLAQANKELYAAKLLAAAQADVTVKDEEASSVSNLEPDVTDVHALWQPSIDDAAKFRDRITPFAWTPVWAAPTKGFSIRKLKKYLLKVRKTNKGKIKSNDGGFHSDGDLIDSAKALNNPLLKSLRDEINRHIHSYLRSLAKSTEQVGGPGLKKYRITLGDTWYNINGKGHYNNVHTHDGSHISGVLYVDDGGDETACTQFYDVRGQRAELASLLDTHLGDLFRPVWAGTNSPTSICPKNGYMVLFPSWLPHSVHALATNGERISISFNAVLEDRPQGSRKEILEPGDRDWPSQLSESVDMATGLELAGGAAAVPMWGRSVSSTRWGGYPEPDGSSLRLHWPTPIRPIVLHELAGSVEAMRRMVHKLEKSDSEGQENVVRRGRSGWAWHAAGHGAGILDHRSEAASDLRDAYYQQIYWYVYEMLHSGRKGAQGTQGDNERVDMAVEIIDSSAHILRQGELLLQQARGKFSQFLFIAPQLCCHVYLK